MTAAPAVSHPPAAAGRGTRFGRALAHSSLLHAVVGRARDGRPALEVGAGSGVLSARLAGWRERVVALDRDAHAIEAARMTSHSARRKVAFVRGDAFHLPFPRGAFSVAFSRGWLADHDEDTVTALLLEQLRVADTVVFSVPSAADPREDEMRAQHLYPAEWEDWIRSTFIGDRYRVRARGYRFDPEGWLHAVRRQRWDGAYHILVTIDPGQPSRAISSCRR